MTNRLRSKFGWKKDQVPLFGGRAIGYTSGAVTNVLTPSYLDEIFFNWRRPSAIVRHIKQLGSEFPKFQPERQTQPKAPLWFSEDDFDSVY
jgi:hypothetical protein